MTSMSIEDYSKSLMEARGETERTVTFLPEPERRERHYTVISVDDHVVEPPDAFVGRLPSKFVERGPKVVDLDTGGQAWVYDGNVMPNVGFNAVAGRDRSEVGFDPTRFDEMRRGAWDIHSRIEDMNLDGVWATLSFPSFLAGFGGGRLQTITKDLDLALATLRAYNDWHLEGWAGAYPDRVIPCQIPWLHDPKVGAEEIRRNAERGFRAVSFPESPDKFGWPSVFSDHWDPILAACEETETVINLHTGSAGMLPSTTPDAPPDVSSILFGVYAMFTCVDWLYSKAAVRFPNIKLCMSEGGIGWVAGLLDRLDHGLRFDDPFRTMTWSNESVTPQEVLGRNFWYCALDDPSSLCQRERIGVDRILVEVDYPHSDSLWPDTQASLHSGMNGLPDDHVRRMTWQNASELYRFPVPESVQRDPSSF